ncbi:MAG: hypothetical protein M3Q83_04220 [Pseudomonadota bacterium]|nr:hypothetical protein [Pseudomonadota bacterium]
MTRTFTTALAAVLLAPGIASAATYSAKPITLVADKRIIARDISWSCGATGCRGVTETSRPLVLCQGLAKQAGRLESFAVDGRPMAVADLDKCNTAARDDGPATLARAD